jgi:glucose/arabinose dehydrogenase
MAFYTGDRYPEWQGSLFVGSLVQKHLLRVVLEGGKVVKEERFYEGRARIRDVRQGPDGYLYILTDEKAPMGRVMRVTP